MGNTGFRIKTPPLCRRTARCLKKTICGLIIHNLRTRIKGNSHIIHLIWRDLYSGTYMPGRSISTRPPLTERRTKRRYPLSDRRNTVSNLSAAAWSAESRSELAVLVSGSDSSPVGRQLAYCH